MSVNLLKKWMIDSHKNHGFLPVLHFSRYEAKKIARCSQDLKNTRSLLFMLMLDVRHDAGPEKVHSQHRAKIEMRKK